MEQKNKVALLSLGCKVNAYDTEAMRSLFLEHGYEIVDFQDYADIYVINTCTVTNIGDKKSRQMIRRARRQNPGAIVVACGCYAQVSPQAVRAMAEVDLVLGTANRSEIVNAVENHRRGIMHDGVGDAMQARAYENMPVRHMRGRTRAFLKIQDGCENFCSYCIVPYARGPVKSRRPKDVMEEVQALAANGYKEIVVTGIHVASYGKDLSSDYDNHLMQLLEGIHETDEIERIRLGSIEPAAVTDRFLAMLGRLPKICGHFHLSLQSGCDKTLAGMNRKYTSAMYRDAAAALRRIRPGCGLATDIIVGFPGETDEDFSISYAFVEEMAFMGIHVFPYSPKKGTPAALFPGQVEERVKDARCQKVAALGQRMGRDFIRQFVGKELAVLFERKKDADLYEGYAGNYINVQVQSNVDLANTVKSVKILSCGDDTAMGEVINYQ